MEINIRSSVSSRSASRGGLSQRRRLIRGKRPYLINRQPCGTHLEALAKVGFVVLSEERTRQSSRLTQGQLARAFRGISTDDLTTAGLYLITKKMGSDRVP